jgi:LacI family transcriptional regulator
LNDSNEVSEETKERIRALAEKMSYIPNVSARALAGKGSRLIGVVVSEIRSNYYAKVIDEIEAVLNAKHYSSILGKTNFRVEEEINHVIALSQRKVDGIIIADPVNAVVGVHAAADVRAGATEGRSSVLQEPRQVGA